MKSCFIGFHQEGRKGKFFPLLFSEGKKNSYPEAAYKQEMNIKV